MSLPAWLRAVLPGDTAESWEKVCSIVPTSAYLVGGTAIAVHLQHRVSRDLEDPVPECGRPAHSGAPTVVEGIRVAGIGDLLATRLKVIGDRGELRDFFDLKVIEAQAGRFMEEGFGLFLRRYRPRNADAAVRHLLLGLGYFDDVADDPFLPETREQILCYWQRRQPRDRSRTRPQRRSVLTPQSHRPQYVDEHGAGVGDEALAWSVPARGVAVGRWWGPRCAAG